MASPIFRRTVNYSLDGVIPNVAAKVLLLWRMEKLFNMLSIISGTSDFVCAQTCLHYVSIGEKRTNAFEKCQHGCAMVSGDRFNN